MGLLKNANEMLIKPTSGVTRFVDENIDQFMNIYGKNDKQGIQGFLNTSIGSE
jgi:hypothetical protein